MAEFVTLGAFGFRSEEVVIGGLPRTIVTNTNCLAAEPVQTVAYTSGYQEVAIRGHLIGTASVGETAVEHLRRQYANLKTEVAKDSNTLTVDWGDGSPETFRVFKNPDFDRALAVHVRKTNLITFTLTLNCLPT